MGDTPVSFDLATQPPKIYLGEHGFTRMHKNKLGIDICHYFWPASPGTQPRGILVLAHGHGGYIQADWLRVKGAGHPGAYAGSIVEALNAAGYSVAANDDRGAGRSGGLRCYCDSFDDYVGDLLDVARTCTTLGASSFDPGLPLFLAGLSKGGCVALIAALKEPSLFSGVICLAPMVSLEKVAKKGINPYLRPLGSVLSWLAPTWAVLAVGRNTMYPDLQEAYDTDPNNYHGGTRIRNAQEYIRATEWLMAHQTELTLPLLLFHSDTDTQTDPEGTKRLYEAAQSADKTLVQPPGRWHILLKEPGYEEIWKQILDWLDQRCPREGKSS